MTRTTQRRLGIVAVVAVAAVAVPVLVSRWRDERRYAAAAARLDADDPHWRLDDRAARLRAATPDDDTNIAGPLADAHAGLGTLDTSWRIRHEELLRNLVPNVRLTRGQWRCVIDGVEAHEDAIPPALALANFPRGRFDFDYMPNGVSVAVPHFNQMFHVHDWLLVPLHLSAVQGGDAATALATTRATFNLARALGEAPTEYAAMHRMTYRAAAVRGLERLLGHVALTDAQLAAVQDDLRAALADDLWAADVRGKLASTDRTLRAIRAGEITPTQVRTQVGPIPVQSLPWRQTTASRTADWLRDRTGAPVVAEHAELLEIAADAVAVTRRPWPERWAAVQALPKRYDMNRPELVRWLTPDYARTFVTFAGDEARTRCALAATVVERYRVARGDWPASLAGLGPLPDDPFTGKPLLLKRVADGVVVYSVGSDGVDDGGIFGAESSDLPPPSGYDIGVRLYDVPRRNRPPVEGQP